MAEKILTNKASEAELIIGSKKTVDRNDIALFKTDILRSLSDETRQGIIIVLGKYRDLCVNDLSAWLNVARSTVSHHLKLLKEAKMVKARKSGKEVYYSLNTRYIRRSLSSLVKILENIEEEQSLL